MLRAPTILAKESHVFWELSLRKMVANNSFFYCNKLDCVDIGWGERGTGRKHWNMFLDMNGSINKFVFRIQKLQKNQRTLSEAGFLQLRYLLDFQRDINTL